MKNDIHHTNTACGTAETFTTVSVTLFVPPYVIHPNNLQVCDHLLTFTEPNKICIWRHFIFSLLFFEEIRLDISVLSSLKTI